MQLYPGHKLKSPLTGTGMTMSQKVLLAGDMAVWLIIHLGLQGRQQETLVRLMYGANFSYLKDVEAVLVDPIHLYMTETFTMTEMHLPVWFNQVTHHQVGHLFEPGRGLVPLLGPSHGTRQEAHERMGRKLKGFVKSRQNVPYTVMKKWTVGFEMGMDGDHHSRFQTSGIQSRDPFTVPEYYGTEQRILLPAKYATVTLDAPKHRQLCLWWKANGSESADALRARYTEDCKGISARLRPTFSDWTPSGGNALTLEEKCIQKGAYTYDDINTCYNRISMSHTRINTHTY